MNNYNKAKENEVERFNKWYDSYENHPTKSNVLGYVIRNYARIHRADREDMREVVEKYKCGKHKKLLALLQKGEE